MAVRKKKHTFFGARFLFIPAGAPKHDVELVLLSGLLQPLCLGNVGGQCGAVVEWIDVPFHGFRIDVDFQQGHAAFLGHAIPEFVHGLEFPTRVHVQKRQWRYPG